MNRAILFFYLFLLLSHLGSQDNVEIPSTANPVFALEASSPFFGVADTFYIDSLQTETFDGVDWTPLYRKMLNAQTGELCPGFPMIAAFIRSSGQSVRYKQINPIPKQGQLYDFSLNTGDSTWIVAWDNNFIDSVLYVVDSIKYKNCIIGDSTKFMYVRALSNFPDQAFNAHRTTWIEGIGDVYHPFLPTTCLNGTCEFLYRSTKFFFDNEWLDVEDLSCEYLVNTSSAPPAPPLVTVSPNPVSTGATLSITSGTHRIDEVRLVSLASGREVFFDEFTPSNTWEVALPSVPTGVYLVRVRTVTGLEAVEKVVIR